MIWKRKKTGEIVTALQWISGENDQEIRKLIISNIPEELILTKEELDGFVQMTLAIIDAHPNDWIIVEPNHTKALTPQAFEVAYEGVIV